MTIKMTLRTQLDLFVATPTTMPIMGEERAKALALLQTLLSEALTQSHPDKEATEASDDQDNA